MRCEPGRAYRPPAAPSSGEFRRDSFPTVTQDAGRLLARDAFKSFQEVVQAQAVRELIKQSLNGQARAAKNWRAAKDSGIRYDQSTGGTLDFSYRAHRLKVSLLKLEQQAWDCAEKRPTRSRYRRRHENLHAGLVRRPALRLSLRTHQCQALGAHERQLPPFDESKFEPMPDVELNPKDEFWVDPDKLDDSA